MITDIYEGALGVAVVLATGQNLFSATKTQIAVRKPDGTETFWNANKHPTSGSIIYITDAGDLDIPGDYRIQAYVEWGSASCHLGKTVIMTINSKYR